MKKIDALRETIKKYLGSEMDAKAFTDVETALALFEKFAPDKDAGQAFLLLHNYSLVGEVNDPPQTALLQKAHVCLRGCSSKQKWQQLLEQYRAVRPSNICFYRLTEEKEDDKKILKLSRNIKAVKKSKFGYCLRAYGHLF
ncbi:MAG: hypothetical protein IJ740_07645 [Ruminococcus sp.]|nr:hypothetical protein [Ruminococcus sp.]